MNVNPMADFDLLRAAAMIGEPANAGVRVMKWGEFFTRQAAVTAEPVNPEAVLKQRGEFVAALEPQLALRDTMLAELPQVDREMPENAEAYEHRKRVLGDVAVLEGGDWGSGYYDRRLTPFSGGPGIRHYEHWIKKCDDIVTGETALRAIDWPSSFRYTGQPGTMHFDGRTLRRGEVVKLSRGQWEAWSDKFEPTTVASEVEAVTS